MQKVETKFHSRSGLALTVILIGYIVYWSLHTAYLYSPMPASKEPNVAMFNRPFPDKAFIDQFIAQIPTDASVSASNNLGSHLSQREVIYVLPHGIDRSEYVLVSDKDGYADTTIASMEKNSAYQKVVEREGFTAFKRK